MGSKHVITDETQELRRCVRELAGLSTLSAVWLHSEPREIAEGLCRVLSRSLDAELVYVRLVSSDGSIADDIAGTHPELSAKTVAADVRTAIERALQSGRLDQVHTIPNPLGTGSLRLAFVVLGHEANLGIVVAGSEDVDFPRQTDRLLLSVGANQAAIVLQQQRSELQVRGNERQLADFFDNATVGLHWVDADGFILRANRAELKMLGYSADEYVGRHIADFHADKEAINDILLRLRAGEELREYEARLLCKDGSIKQVVIDSSVRWEDGQFVHTRCFTRDITDRKVAEEAVRQREKFLLLQKQTLEMVVSGAPLSDVLSLLAKAMQDNSKQRMRAAIHLLDDSGTRFKDAIAPDLPDSYREATEGMDVHSRAGPCCWAVLSGTVVTVPDIDGDPKYCAFAEFAKPLGIRSAWSMPIVSADGKVLATFANYYEQPGDPTAEDLQIGEVLTRTVALAIQRQRGEAAVQMQAERLRLLWEAAALLLSADDPDAMLRGLFAKIAPHLGVDTYFNFMVNDQGDALRLASCVGIPLETARAISRLEFGQAVCGTVAQHGKPIVATHIQQSDDPKVQLVKSFGLRAYACNPLIVENRLLGTLSFASRTRDDFSPDEVAFLETICHYVTVAYERLRLMNELKEADRRKDEFLATLAHELRNPLAPVRNAVQILRLKGPDEPELRWGREVIDRQVEHLTRLIDDLMDIARITRNKLELRTQRVDLVEVIKGAIESARPSIEQCAHELIVSLPVEPVYVTGDLVRLAQVFINLLNNAAKYAERGGRIWLTAERQENDVVIRVRDTGVGIPAEKLPRLFEMFFQVDRSRDGSQGGLGIGLSLVRRLVELHGGTVQARSEGVNKGSEFIVRLPVLVEQPKPANSSITSGNGNAKTTLARRILVVDDNRDSADSLAMLLQLAGNDVRTAYDGVEGIETAEQFRPDVVLLDIGMPRLNGEDACRRIRQEPWGKDMLLVALTGWGQEDDRRRTVEAGFNAHLVKPIDSTALMDLLASRTPTAAVQLTHR